MVGISHSRMRSQQASDEDEDDDVNNDENDDVNDDDNDNDQLTLIAGSMHICFVFFMMIVGISHSRMRSQEASGIQPDCPNRSNSIESRFFAIIACSW